MIFASAGRLPLSSGRRLAAVLGALLLLAALAFPQSRNVALAVLAAGGVAVCILGALGLLALIPFRARFHEGIETALLALPGAFAVTTAKGDILWHTERFADLGAGLISEDRIAPVRTSVALSAAVYRLFAAASRGVAHAERVETGQKDRALNLSVKPECRLQGGSRTFVWSVTEDDAGHRSGVEAATFAAASGVGGAANPIANDAFKAFAADSPLPIAEIALDGKVRNANAAVYALLPMRDARTAMGAYANEAASIFEPFTDPGPLRRYLAGLSPNGGPFDSLMKVKATSGTGSERLRVMAHPAGADAAIVVLLAVPDAASMDDRTVQAQKMQAVGELAGGIAHDFNNLLTAIIGFSDLLLVRFRPSDPAFKDLMNIKNNANRAAELVRHILAYSRRQTLRPAILTLTDVIEDFHSSMGRVLGEKVKADIQHGRDLWFVKADESQIFQVIMNLAVNARDAMPDGGSIAIRTSNVTAREAAALADRGLDRGEYVMCEVRDTGTGIKPEHLAKIFDPFFSTKEVGKGTGLGLSTVYGIVKQTGGTILVDSQIGSGTSFRIYLPRYAESEEERLALDVKPEMPAGPADLTGSGTVLLVEDEDAVRSFASRALATRGYTVIEAASGVEALEAMEREGGNIDLVVSDVVMPEMDGPTLLRHLRKKNPSIKIVFMSGYAEEAFRKNLDEDEWFVFLPKPFTLKKLAETVKAAATA